MTHDFLLPEEVHTPLGVFRIAGEIHGGFGVSVASGAWRVYGGYAVVAILGGTGEYRDANGYYEPLSPGVVITVFPELPHRYGPQKRQTWDELYLTFDGAQADLWRSAGLLDSHRPVAHPCANWANDLHRFIADLSRPSTILFEQLHHFASFQVLLAALLPPDASAETALPSDSSWLAQARGLLEDAPATPLDLDEVAARLAVSYETFRKRFQKETGISPAQYRLQKRVEAAKRLLTYAPQTTNRQVALSLGFADEYHFSKRFTEIVGLTPRAFRRHVLGEE